MPLTIVLIPLISSSIVNGTMLNFGKKYEDNLRVIFDQWPKLHLGLDTLSNQKNLEWYLILIQIPRTFLWPFSQTLALLTHH